MHGILSYDDFYVPTEIISVELCVWSDLFPHMPSATQSYNSTVSTAAVVYIISASVYHVIFLSVSSLSLSSSFPPPQLSLSLSLSLSF